jgi:hypothetical protein
MVVVLGATALIVASSQPTRADPVRVDQVSSLSASSSDAASAATAQAPSFLVGISGQLVTLEVFLSRFATVGPADARTGNGGGQTQDVSGTLANWAISPFATPGLSGPPVQFDLAAAQLQMISGRLLALVQGNPAAARAFPAAESGASVTVQAGGPAFVAPPAASGSAGVGRALFAQPDPVPEPTTIALVGSGLLLGAMGRRRRKRQESMGQ